MTKMKKRDVKKLNKAKQSIKTCILLFFYFTFLFLGVGIMFMFKEKILGLKKISTTVAVFVLSILWNCK